MSDYTVRAVLEAYDKNFTSGMKKAASAIGSTESAASGLGSKIKSGLGFGALMAIGQKAVNAISTAITSNLGNAVKRFDTLNNFPKIMKNLGYSSSDAEKAIAKMSKGIDGLPTALDSIAGATQKIAPLTGSLSKATDVTLALNNALLAGGKDAQTQANALEQFSQMMSAGKVDMQAWRSMLSAMPGQMNQLAQSMLGPKANANDLYEAMKSGKITFDDFNNALIKLNEEGLESGGKKFASFADQARDATKGIGTSIANLKTGVVKGLTEMIGKADGILHISDNINKLNKNMKGLFSRIAQSKAFSNVLQGTVKILKAFSPAVKVVGKALAKAGSAFGKGVKYLGDHANAVKKAAKALAILWAAFKGMSVLSAFGGAITNAVGMVGRFAGAVKGAGGVASLFAGSTAGIGLAAVGAVASVGILAAAIYTLAKNYKAASREANKHIQARKDSLDATDQECSRIDALYRELEELNGVENKTTDEKKRMKWIVDQLNGSIDGLNIKYDEEKGKVEGGTDAIKKRIDAYKEEAKAAALKDALKGAYKDQIKNEQKLANAYQKRQEAQKKADQNQRDGLENKGAAKKANQELQKYNNKVRDLESASKKYNNEIAGLEARMGNLGSMNAFDDLVAKAKKAGIDVTQGFIASVRQGQVNVPSSIFEMVQMMTPALDSAVQKANAAGIKIPDSIRQGIESGKLSPAEAAKQIMALVDAAEKTQPPKSQTNGAKTANAHAAGISSGKGQNQSAAASLVDSAVQKLIAGAGKAQNPGNTAGSNYAKGISSKSGEARSSGSKLADSAHSGASKSGSYGSARGGEFASGFVGALRSAVGTAASVAASIASKAAAAIKKIQNSGSPSRVTMGLGRDFGAGYVIGIQKQYRNVQKAAMGMVSIPSINSPQLATAGASMNASVQYSMAALKEDLMQALESRPIEITNVTELDGREVSRVTAPYIETAINQMQTRENRKKGIL